MRSTIEKTKRRGILNLLELSSLGMSLSIILRERKTNKKCLIINNKKISLVKYRIKKKKF
jgi:hypothetical protein